MTDFDSIGKALKLARTSKGLDLKRLSFGTGIRMNRLIKIEQDKVAAAESELKMIEKYVGVGLIHPAPKTRLDLAL